jgi:hypothetical protein
MTEEELKMLRPGDKITYDTSGLSEALARDIEEGLERSNGYFTFTSYSDSTVFAKSLDGEEFVFGYTKNIRLYESLPWSYERDY